MLWKCCTQHASKFGKLSSGHRTGKGQFSFQSQRKETQENVQTTTQLHSSQFSSVTQLCLTLCNLMDCSTPGFPVHRQLPEFIQTHAHEYVMPSNQLILCHALLFLPSIFPSIRVFSSESVLCITGQSTAVSASASVLPVNIQDQFHLGWTGWISLQSKGLSKPHHQHHSSITTVQKQQFFCSQSSL